MQEEIIKTRIVQALGEDTQVELSSFDGLHYSAVVRARIFTGKPRLEQHRMVLKALEDVISNNDVHALQLKTEAMES